MGTFKNFMWTFWIGFVAGVAPFVALRLVPGIFDPRAQPETMSYWIIVILGALVGFITAILYSKVFEQTQARDIFFTALGIPALLIATVSDLSTRKNAEALAISASTVTHEEIEISTPSAPLVEEPVAKPAAMLDLFLPREARAQPRTTTTTTVSPRATTMFIVVITSYSDAASADARAKYYRDHRMAAEQFVKKDIRVFRAGQSAFYVSYTSPQTKDEAIRIYRLLKISDPKLTPSIVSLGG